MVQDILISNKTFLPVYRPLRDSEADVNLLWGGRDSGKSYFIAQKMVIDCMRNEYFRCVMIKKTAESIKDSQWQTIKEVVEKWNLTHLFDFKSHPLEINCVNGGKFLARGCDNPQKLKSIRNPSHSWYEEADQLAHEDYIVASSSLRSDKGRVKEMLSFNPEADGNYTTHWIYKTFLKNNSHRMYDGMFSDFIEVKVPGISKPVKINFTSTHTTYHVNKFCTPERAAKLESYAESMPYFYDVYCLGKWGTRSNENPFLFTFKREKHVGTTKWSPLHPTYISFDFNKNPICCNVFQFIDGHIYGIESIRLPNSDIDSLCIQINSKYVGALFVVTGDHSGYNRSALVKDDWNYYSAIKMQLQLSDSQFWTYVNPRIEENQVACNRVFQMYPVTLDKENCAPLIYDNQMAEMNAEGKLKKENREDINQQLDNLDCERYFFHALIQRGMIIV